MCVYVCESLRERVTKRERDIKLEDCECCEEECLRDILSLQLNELNSCHQPFEFKTSG